MGDFNINVFQVMVGNALKFYMVHFVFLNCNTDEHRTSQNYFVIDDTQRFSVYLAFLLVKYTKERKIFSILDT